MSHIGTVLEAATADQQAEIVQRLVEQPEAARYFYTEVIDEIGRRLLTMPPETFVRAACDILRQSRIEPPDAEVE